MGGGGGGGGGGPLTISLTANLVPTPPSCSRGNQTSANVSDSEKRRSTGGGLQQRKKSHSLRGEASKHEKEEDEEDEEGTLSRSASLPSNAIRRWNSRRASQTALNGIVIGVGGAACIYAIVSSLMRH